LEFSPTLIDMVYRLSKIDQIDLNVAWLIDSAPAVTWVKFSKDDRVNHDATVNRKPEYPWAYRRQHLAIAGDAFLARNETFDQRL
jgi:hypothetical protein